MKRTAFAMAFASVFSIGAAQAQDFQMEGGLGYSDFSPDVGPSDSALSADFTYHVNRVKTTGHPLAEAAFLQRSSNLALAYATFDEADVDVLALQGEFYINQFYLRGRYQTTDVAGTATDTISLRGGYVLTQGLRLAAGVDMNSVDNVDDDTNDFVLEAKYVNALGGGKAVNIEGDLNFEDDAFDTTTLNLRGDFFFMPAASAGVRLSSSDSDAASGSTTDFGIGARVFFTPTFSGEAEYSTLVDGDGNLFSLRVALRFG